MPLVDYRNQPEAATCVSASKDCFWPTDDVPHQLTVCRKPGAQGADLKVSFAVLRSQVARPGFGQELKFSVSAPRPASGWLPTFSGDNQTTALDPLRSFAARRSVRKADLHRRPQLLALGAVIVLHRSIEFTTQSGQWGL